MWRILGRERVSRRVAIALVWMTGIVVILFVGVFAIDRMVEVDGLKKFVNLDSEANLSAWWNSSLLLLVAALSVVAAWCTRSQRIRRAWALIAFATGLMSLDEISSMHEKLGAVVDATGLDLPTFSWLAIGAVVALAGIAVLLVIGRALPRPTATRLGAALGLYALGALVVEAFNGWWYDVRPDVGGPDLVFATGVILEEGLEMVACIVAITVILDFLQETGAVIGVPAEQVEPRPAKRRLRH